MEQWKDIEGYEGLYQISSYGRVKSLERTIIKKNKGGNYSEYRLKEKILKPHVISENDHHLQVKLYKDSVSEHKYLHKLVAEAFISNPNHYDAIHHIDHNPQNNRVENLIWMDEKEHAAMHMKETLSKQVYQYTLDGKLVAVYCSTMEAAKQTGFIQTGISKCCNGGLFDKKKNKWINMKQHKGYMWSYTPL